MLNGFGVQVKGNFFMGPPCAATRLPYLACLTTLNVLGLRVSLGGLGFRG